jgi:predicted SnoaL-like aldol condensation-catalyzing enzyme
MLPKKEINQMSAKKKKNLVRRFFEELNRNNFDIIDEIFAPDFYTNIPEVPPGSQGYKRWLIEGYIETGGMKNGIERIEVEGDVVRIWLMTRGRDIVIVSETPDYFRIENGKIAEHWGPAF